MYWLIVPVLIYSALIFTLWLVIRHTKVPEMFVPENKSFISVVTACHNEEKTIAGLLSCLTKQNYLPGNYEIIIIDDNSTDNTSGVIKDAIVSLRSDTGPQIRFLNSSGTGKKSALRQAIMEAKGELILTTDADCRMGSRWLSAYSSCYESCGADMMLASVSDKGGRGFWSALGRYEFAALQGITEAAVYAGRPVMCNGANMGFRKEVYMRYADCLHEDVPSGDDMFLLHAVKCGGGRIKFLGCTAAAVETAAAVSAAALLRQRARWASKAFFYRDGDTLALAAATAACNAAVTAAALASPFVPGMLLTTLILYAVRLGPDYLIIKQNMKKRKEHMPLYLFIIMELIYPFYFTTVALLSLFPPMRRFGKRL